MSSNRIKGRGGWVFLIIMSFIYFSLFLIEPKIAHDTGLVFANILRQVLPALGLVFLLLLLANLFLDPSRVKRYLGKTSGIRGWFIAVFSGIFSVGSVYAWYAMLSDLKKKGMAQQLIVAFLYSRAIKLPLLPLMIHYFGVAYTLILSLYLVIFAILNGLLVGRLQDRLDES